MTDIAHFAEAAGRSRVLLALGRQRDRVLVFAALAGLALGGALWFAGLAGAAGLAWGAATAPVLVVLLVQIGIALSRAEFGLDIVAALSMSAALAFGEPLAANVVALMYSGGQLLEHYAEGRARREMTTLLGRVARTAMLQRGSELTEVPIEAIEPGDILLIRQGEVLPVDGLVAAGQTAELDVSALTGEPLPMALNGDQAALSGSTSLDGPFNLVATRRAAESAYAQIVRLVEAARASKSPMMRLADRYALGFLAFTLILSGAAWLLAGDPTRAVAVLVVATPCPLILAVPIAFISGMSRAAAIGVLVKSAGVFEALARIKVVIMDKTGTLTHGRAELTRIRTANGFSPDEILRLAASLDQASGHVLAATLIAAANAQGLALTAPGDIHETPGAGIEGTVEGRRVLIGGDGFVADRIGATAMTSDPADAGSATVVVAIDGQFAGALLLDDPVRTDAVATVAALRRAGVERLIVASGDRVEIAESVGRQMRADEIRGALTPTQKVDVVRAARAFGPTMMVGDGVNDAPALAAADVGVAMGARGSAASSETAGAVLLVDRLQPLANAITIAGRARRIALQSVWIGLGLSATAMGVAALGYLPPVEGALLQEAIDVGVILNALRALA